jgi:hypothetical protein
MVIQESAPLASGLACCSAAVGQAQRARALGLDKESENVPEYRIQAAGNYEIGAAWKKVSKADWPYLSVTLDETPSNSRPELGNPAAHCQPRIPLANYNHVRRWYRQFCGPRHVRS